MLQELEKHERQARLAQAQRGRRLGFVLFQADDAPIRPLGRRSPVLDLVEPAREVRRDVLGYLGADSHAGDERQAVHGRHPDEQRH